MNPKPPATDAKVLPETAEPAPGTPPPVLQPAKAKDNVHPDPTRYGDWERKGRCIDF